MIHKINGSFQSYSHTREAKPRKTGSFGCSKLVNTLEVER